MNSRRLLTSVVVFGMLLTACAGSDDTAAEGPADDPSVASEPGGEGELLGLLRLTEGACEDEGVTEGSWFRMVQSGGTVADGPFVSNGDSPCGDTTWLPLSAGSDGGLVLGEYQPPNGEAFDESGNALASAIVQPAPWFAVDFAVSTNAIDPQTETEATPPTVVHDGEGLVSGDLRAFAASWNGQHFNQGSPKPDGSMPGTTTPVSGSFDPDTGELVLEWSSQIVGGPFDQFTGVWHLEGTLER